MSTIVEFHGGPADGLLVSIDMFGDAPDRLGLAGVITDALSTHGTVIGIVKLPTPWNIGKFWYNRSSVDGYKIIYDFEPPPEKNSE